MGGRGSSSGMGAYERNMNRIEGTIRNETVEHLILADDKGKELHRTSDGESSEVGLTPEMIRNARDNVITHNHPRGRNFSMEDIQVAQYYGVRELRATTRDNGTYVLRRTYELGKPPAAWQRFALDYQRAFNQTQRIIQGRIDRGELGMNPSGWYREEGRLMGEWLKNNAETYGWKYRKER